MAGWLSHLTSDGPETNFSLSSSFIQLTSLVHFDKVTYPASSVLYAFMAWCSIKKKKQHRDFTFHHCTESNPCLNYCIKQTQPTNDFASFCITLQSAMHFQHSEQAVLSASRSAVKGAFTRSYTTSISLVVLTQSSVQISEHRVHLVPPFPPPPLQNHCAAS